MEKYEDKSICAKCGGYCCKKCGCDYFVSDFESMKLDYLESILNTGRVSVVAMLDFRHINNGNLIAEPILYLRARNKDRDVIDLLSFKTTCASLEEDGCHFTLEDRPSGGVSLIPKENMECYSAVDRLNELEKWTPYQSVLYKIVKRHTGMSVNSKLKTDAEALFTHLFNKDLTGVSNAEVIDVLNMLPMLSEVYHEEFTSAKKQSEKRNVLLVKQKK